MHRRNGPWFQSSEPLERAVRVRSAKEILKPLWETKLLCMVANLNTHYAHCSRGHYF